MAKDFATRDATVPPHCTNIYLSTKAKESRVPVNTLSADCSEAEDRGSRIALAH